MGAGGGAGCRLALAGASQARTRRGRSRSKHRTATVAFLRFEGADALIAAKGAERAAGVLGELIATVGAAADERQVCFLRSDIDADSGKIDPTAGAPLAIGDEEERMLLVLRRIISTIGYHLPCGSASIAGPFSPVTSGPTTGARTP